MTQPACDSDASFTLQTLNTFHDWNGGGGGGTKQQQHEAARVIVAKQVIFNHSFFKRNKFADLKKKKYEHFKRKCLN